MAIKTVLDDVLALAELLHDEDLWSTIRDGIPAWHPRNDGEGTGGGGEGEGGGDGDGSAEGEGTDEGESGGDGQGAGKEPDWKSESRKHERRAKTTAKELEQARKELEELRKGQQTDQEKALNEAVEKAKAEARGEYESERRNDRLEVAVTRLGAKAFADVDDALLHIQRGIASGDVDADDIFNDEGKVQTDALQKALDELLERKPHLAADPSGGRLRGDGDGGKGRGDAGLEDMSPDDWDSKLYASGSRKK